MGLDLNNQCGRALVGVADPGPDLLVMLDKTRFHHQDPNRMSRRSRDRNQRSELAGSRSLSAHSSLRTGRSRSLQERVEFRVDDSIGDENAGLSYWRTRARVHNGPKHFVLSLAAAQESKRYWCGQQKEQALHSGAQRYRLSAAVALAITTAQLKTSARYATTGKARTGNHNELWPSTSTAIRVVRTLSHPGESERGTCADQSRALESEHEMLTPCRESCSSQFWSQMSTSGREWGPLCGCGVPLLQLVAHPSPRGG